VTSGEFFRCRYGRGSIAGIGACSFEAAAQQPAAAATGFAKPDQEDGAGPVEQPENELSSVLSIALVAVPPLPTDPSRKFRCNPPVAEEVLERVKPPAVFDPEHLNVKLEG
jgi:hypothetical protein